MDVILAMNNMMIVAMCEVQQQTWHLGIVKMSRLPHSPIEAIEYTVVNLMLFIWLRTLGQTEEFPGNISTWVIKCPHWTSPNH